MMTRGSERDTKRLSGYTQSCKELSFGLRTDVGADYNCLDVMPSGCYGAQGSTSSTEHWPSQLKTTALGFICREIGVGYTVAL